MVKSANKNARRTLTSLVALCGLAGGAALLGGCSGEMNRSFLDPSVTGSWGNTPKVMPILKRLATIEGDNTEPVEYSEPLPEDLIPRPVSYRIGPGDVLDVTIYDIVATERPEVYQVPVDPRGMIEIPQLGRILVADRTTEEAVKAIGDVVRARNIVSEPLVQVIASSQRQTTYTLIGAVQNPGLFPIPKADYRLLEAISVAGQFDQSLDFVYVIRQVPLTDEAAGRPTSDTEGAPMGDSGMPAAAPGAQPTGDDLLSIIDGVAPDAPKDAAKDAPKDAPAAPGMLRMRQGGDGSTPRIYASAQDGEPMIDLIESEANRAADGQEGSWVYLNGRWVKVRQATEADAAGTTIRPDELITQRVIRVPIKDLLAGKQSINLVIRPGDVIRFPSPPQGFVTVSGQVARPGPYQVTPNATLLRTIANAGGLTETGIPWRVELTRMVGSDRQATVRVDLDAIARHTAPDIFIKDNDLINVGTTGWALPLAVVRNGFRVSYGFGFLLDRNLSNDLFGPPPTNVQGQ